MVGNSYSNREGLGPDDVISVYKSYQRVSTGDTPTRGRAIGIKVGEGGLLCGGLAILTVRLVLREPARDVRGPD